MKLRSTRSSYGRYLDLLLAVVGIFDTLSKHQAGSALVACIHANVFKPNKICGRSRSATTPPSEEEWQIICSSSSDDGVVEEALQM